MVRDAVAKNAYGVLPASVQCLHGHRVYACSTACSEYKVKLEVDIYLHHHHHHHQPLFLLLEN
jgi:hypothetical protein